ncbi:MAG: hypothetical protein L0346_03020 [Chloroflexi bacterium]|nr:hypothetical protein [Chloroflexota bacterium]
MSLRGHLEQQIAEAYALLNQYEELERTTRDPRERSRYRSEIKRQREAIRELEAELVGLEGSGAAGPRFYANANYPEETAFTGRTEELTLLDNWLANDPAHPLLALIALGGTGKSALAWRWQSVGARRAVPLQTIIWWDFYQPNAGVAEFLNDVLTFIGDRPQEYGNSRLQLSRLWQRLDQGPTLVVLDGAERLLRAYGSLGAAYLGDAEAEVGERHARDCVDPVAGTLLAGLAQRPGCKTLLTSRLLPRELEGRAGGLLAGVRRHTLTGLSLEESQQLFKTLGIQATRAEVQAVCEPLGYHPLSLRLLAGYVAHDPAQPNDLRAAVHYDPTDDLLGRRQHVLSRAYDSLPETARQLLSQLAAFRSSVSWETVVAVFGGDGTEAQRAARLQDALWLLERRGLVQRAVQDGRTSYDLHPIVRRYAYDRLADPAGTHGQLVAYFEAMPKLDKVQTLAELEPVLELYHHLVCVGRYDKARSVYYKSLRVPMYYQLGAYQQVVALIQALFPDGEEKPPRLNRENYQAWGLNALANGYSRVGQPQAAVSLLERANAIRKQLGYKKGLAIGLGYLADQQVALGALKAAEDNLLHRITLCQEMKDLFREGIGHLYRGRLLAYVGKWAEAKAELDTALIQFRTVKRIHFQGIAWTYYALVTLLQGQGIAGLDAVQNALRLENKTARKRFSYERDHVQVYWLWGWALLALRKLTVAQEHLDEALRRCRAINLVELEPAILLAQARLARAGGQNSILPYQYAEEALQIAERAGYRLHLADIHNFLAHLALDEGDRDKARRHAQQARDYAWCDGPPHAYQVGLEEAERVLKRTEGGGLRTE